MPGRHGQRLGQRHPAGAVDVHRGRQPEVDTRLSGRRQRRLPDQPDHLDTQPERLTHVFPLCADQPA
ncbi:hypothetical protein SBRY_100033 [Actinacidiphila bryophytorum]|uniref:Uncharacterized protein n=1 Tax=Actinacidiphila bryophytorum TaxID=1436133 RepID=A0A9W4E3X1_9ACTN|nr:hypothetical protein SBRY_100033 [Actinacidiphila bryophytorum]